PSLRLLRTKGAVDLSIRSDELSQQSHLLRGVPCANAFDGDLSSGFDEARFEAITNHSAGRPCFERPFLHVAGRVFYFEEKPGVLIFQSDLREYTRNRHRFICIEGRRKRVMRERWHCKKEEGEAR